MLASGGAIAAADVPILGSVEAPGTGRSANLSVPGEESSQCTATWFV